MIDEAIAPKKLDRRARALGLEPYLLQLEMDGLAVIPPQVHGVPLSTFDAMTETLLARAEEMVGCPFSLDRGPHAELEFPETATAAFADLNEKPAEPPDLSLFVIQRLGGLDRAFRDLAVNPVAVALARHMIGSRDTRLSSFNGFMKWRGAYGYGESLGMHADQTTVPLPWGPKAFTANTNWILTDYTREGGALAYVPGSHRFGARPSFPQAVQQAIPVEAPRGSLIVFHGATWHGAFPRTIPGMRIMVAIYYRHFSVAPQEEIKFGFDRDLARDCADPALFRALAGFDDENPYIDQRLPVPRAKRA